MDPCVACEIVDGKQRESKAKQGKREGVNSHVSDTVEG
jgi:hypothetical protein